MALLFVVTPLAHASPLTQTQVSAIISLLQSFDADSTTIANVEAALGGTIPARVTCVTITRDMTPGSTGVDVVSLQTFLEGQGYFTYTGAKGYFGPITATSVRVYQSAHGLPTTGVLDAQTRALMACGTLPPSTVSFTANPTSGAAPLTVQFNGTAPFGYSIDYGDRTPTPLVACSGNPCGSFNVTVFASHTYSSPGTYSASLIQAGKTYGNVIIMVNPHR